MKKLLKTLIITICILCFMGCGNQELDNKETTAEKENISQNKSEKLEKDTYILYLPDEEYIEFTTIEKTIASKENLAKLIIESLHDEGVLSENVTLLSFDINDEVIIINLSKDFETLISSQGTTGEYFIIGCIVNSFIDNYNVEKVQILVEGNTFESGHVIYDKPQTKYE